MSYQLPVFTILIINHSSLCFQSLSYIRSRIWTGNEQYVNDLFIEPGTIIAQTHVYLKYLISTLAGVFAYYSVPAKVGIKSCTDMLQNASFVHTFCLVMFTL